MHPTLIVHGGAGATTPELSAAQRSGCTAALQAGWHVLIAGGSALDAVCEAVAQLEDDPTFNAGVGSCLTATGSVEMDAAVMAGDGLRAGAVAVSRIARNPVRLARAIMEDGRHVLLAGPAADEFARQHAVPTCTPQELITPRQAARWQQRHQQAAADAAASVTDASVTDARPTDANSTGTVGAAAVDRRGHVAAATSTGGIFYKLPGRVGDSPIIGAGTYADDQRGAASATGDGEAVIRIGLARSVVHALANGSAPEWAAQQGIVELARRGRGSGGIIVVDPLGRFGYAHNTVHMTVGYMRADLSDYVVRV